MRIYECRYVRREDIRDLVWGCCWRPALLVDDFKHYGEIHRASCSDLEARMFDKETGKNVGNTANFCINPHCMHVDCTPLTLIWEGEGR